MRELAYAGAPPACPDSRQVAPGARVARRAGREHGLFALLAASPGHMLIRNPGRVVLPDWFKGPLAHLPLRHDGRPPGLGADRDLRGVPRADPVRDAAATAPCRDRRRRAERSVRARSAAAVVGRVQLHLLWADRRAARPRPLSRHARDHPPRPRLRLRRLAPHPSIYGPLFTLGSYPIGLLSVSAALWSFKALAASRASRSPGWCGSSPKSSAIRGAAAAAVFGLNPIVLIWAVGGAHNDLLMLAVMFAGSPADRSRAARSPAAPRSARRSRSRSPPGWRCRSS